jgi:hypothetical protein
MVIRAFSGADKLLARRQSNGKKSQENPNHVRDVASVAEIERTKPMQVRNRRRETVNRAELNRESASLEDYISPPCIHLPSRRVRARILAATLGLR